MSYGIWGSNTRQMHFFKGVCRLRLVVRTNSTFWDLDLVLEAPCASPFKHIESVDTKFRSYTIALLLYYRAFVDFSLHLRSRGGCIPCVQRIHYALR